MHLFISNEANDSRIFLESTMVGENCEYSTAYQSNLVLIPLLIVPLPLRELPGLVGMV